MNQSSLPLKEVPDLTGMEALGDHAHFLYVQFQTQLRNLMLAYLHALTQSTYELKFYDNGAIKSIAPKGWEE